MPINPNIALGVQPIQQPNMLGQMGQIMALKAAQQETEGYEGVKGAIASGMSPNDPRMLQFGPRGVAAYKAAGEGAVKQQELLAKSFENNLKGFGAVRSKEDLVNYSVGQLSDPYVGPWLKSRGITPEKLTANLEKEIATLGFETVLKKSAMGLEKFYADETSRYSTNVAAGTAANRLAFDEKKFEFEKANPGFEYKTLNDGSIAAVNKRSNAVTILQAPGAAPAAPPVNALTPTPAANLNSLLNPPVVNQPGAPTRANAAALPTTPLRAAPRPGYEYNAQGQQVPISDPTKVVSTVTDKFGTVSMLNAAGDVINKVEGMGKPSPGVEKQQEKEVTSKEGKESVNRVLSNLYSEYGNLVKSGGITDTRRSVEENISARTGASAVGQLTGSFTGSEAQSFRDSIEQTRPLLLTAIMKATGLSATQLNSNVELQTYLKTATDPKVSIQSNVKALNNISQMFGLGEKFELPEIPKATSSPKAAKPADAVPPGLPPDIAALWPYISPEDRKLWQK
jgi:hypothetical protein